MAQRKPTIAEIKAAKLIQDEFAGAEFVTTYEGLGDTWDFTIQPVMIGIYQRREEVEMLKYGSKTELEMRKVYTFKISDGTLAAVWGSFSLERGLGDIEYGDIVRITYSGKSDIAGTDKTVKDFKIEVAKK